MLKQTKQFAYGGAIIYTYTQKYRQKAAKRPQQVYMCSTHIYSEINYVIVFE